MRTEPRNRSSNAPTAPDTLGPGPSSQRNKPMQTLLGKHPTWVICALASLIAFSSAEIASAYEIFLEVSRTEAGFTVDAEDANLLQILQALGREAGFSVRDSGASHPPIDLFEVKDASLDTTLRKLLGNANHLILYRGDPGKKVIDKVILLSPGEKRAPARSNVSSLAGPGGKARPRSPVSRERQPPEEDSETEIAALEAELLSEEDNLEEEVPYDNEDEEFEAEQIEATATEVENPRARISPEVIEKLRQGGITEEMHGMLTPEQIMEFEATGLQHVE